MTPITMTPMTLKLARRSWPVLALCCLIPLVACDTESPTVYRSVIIDDDGVFQQHRSDNVCATSSLGAHGADIDAVGLFDDDGTTLLGYFTTARAKLGTTCDIAAQHSDPGEATGSPDGTLTTNFVSLGGGAIIGSFGNSIAIEPGNFVVVYEIGDDFCAGVPSCVGNECYHVFLATDLDCLDKDRTKCQLRITDGTACGESAVDMSGF
jgi:hypothetical protein